MEKADCLAEGSARRNEESDMSEKNEKKAGTDGPLYLRGAAVAKILGVNRKTVYRWMRSHILPFTKIHGTILFRRADLETVLERLSVPSVVGAGKRRRGARSEEGGAA